LIGGLGSERLEGGNGRDELLGGSGADVLLGQDHNDILYGGLGDDRLRRGNRYDSLRGGDGNDDLSGGSLAMLVKSSGGSDSDYLYGGFFRVSGTYLLEVQVTIEFMAESMGPVSVIPETISSTTADTKVGVLEMMF